MIRYPSRRSCARFRIIRLMLLCWRKQSKMRKELFIVITVGLVGLWWLTRYWQSEHVNIGQLLSLHVNNNNVKFQLNSPDGSTRLQGTLGSVDGGVVVAGSVKRCSIVGSRHEGGCSEMKVTASGKNESLLRLEVAHSSDADCYTVKWLPHVAASGEDISVIDCYALDNALWYLSLIHI